MRSIYIVIGLIVLFIIGAVVFTKIKAAKNVPPPEKVVTVPPPETPTAPVEPPQTTYVVPSDLIIPLGDEVPVVPPSIDELVDQLHFNTYEAALGDLSVCGQDEFCSENAKQIKAFFCVVQVCTGTDASKKPTDCFSDSFPQEIQDHINAALCPVIKNPSAETRQAFAAKMPESNEDFLVESGAYGMAMSGNVEGCETYLKSYFGPYGSRWNSRWYQALAGCRILAGKSTVEEEKKDFHTWFEVLQGSNKCDSIVNSDLRDACTSLGANADIKPQP
jgi:hypothetical protein